MLDTKGVGTIMDNFPSSEFGSSEGDTFTQTRTVTCKATGLAHPDLITFLAVAQKYNVEFVPIVWQEGLGLLGEGGTANVNQLMLHTHLALDDSTEYDSLKNTESKETSFAFKRTSEYRPEGGVAEGPSLYKVLIMEVVILRQQVIRDHPNIVDLEGICWEITDTNRIYPVLLFEKANWGDLGSFSSGLRGGYCTFNAKLGYCVDIAKALQAMHGLNIVHGDLKPKNVLLFNDEPNAKKYTTSGRAKLTDFGYSCFGAQDSDVVYLPYSDIWSAPEYHDRGFELKAAKKADIFGFGLTAVYLLFYWEVWDHLIAPTASEMRGFIKDGSMLRRVQGAIAELYDDDNESHGSSLLQFFTKTLANEAEDRETNTESLIQLLRQAIIISSEPVLSRSRFVSRSKPELIQKIVATQPHLYKSPHVPKQTVKRVQEAGAAEPAPLHSPYVPQPSAGRIRRVLDAAFSYEIKAPRFNFTGRLRRARPNIENPPVMEITPRLQTALNWEDISHEEFSISKLMMALLLTDYRVRQEICSVMIARLDDPSTYLGACELCRRYTAFQLALCYELGFGLPADNAKVGEYLASSGKPESDLRDELSNLKQVCGLGFIDLQSRPAKLVDNGNIIIWDFVDEYHLKGLNLSEVQKYHCREINDMKRVLGDDVDIVRMLKAIQARIYVLEGDFKIAEQGHRDLLQSCLRKYGDREPGTLYAKQQLGAILLDTGKSEEAEDLLHSAYAGFSSILGENHLSTLAAQNQWCETLHVRGRHEEAMQTYKAIYERIVELLGVQHPDSLTAMANWASALDTMGDFKYSKNLHSLVSIERELVLGPTHELTLDSKTHLASALRHLGSYAEAEKIHQSALDGFEDAVGASAISVTRTLEEYALTLEVQCKFQEAEILRRRADGLVYSPQTGLQPEVKNA